MKKKPMSISPSELRLLSILAAAIIVFILYSYVINPALLSGSLLSQENKAAEAELTRINTLIEKYPTLKEDVSVEKKLLAEKYKIFFYDLKQEQILYKLDSLMVNSGFNITSYVTTKPSAAPIIASSPNYKPLTYPLLDKAKKMNPSLEPEPAAEQNANQDASGGENQIQLEAIPTTDITLSFSNASYESVMAFIKSLEDMDKSLFVRTISMAKSEAGTGGQIILSLYSLPKPDDSDMDLLKFKPVIPKDKVNPFN